MDTSAIKLAVGRKQVTHFCQLEAIFASTITTVNSCQYKCQKKREIAYLSIVFAFI
jgi:hypothetical protein